MLDALYQCHTLACTFGKIPTQATIFYQLFLLVFTVVVLLILSKRKKNVLGHYLIMLMGAFIFEFFTAPMWINLHLGSWGYIYHGVSWVITVGLAAAALASVFLVNALWPKLREAYKYLLSVLILWPVMIGVEKFIVFIGIREYAPETLKAFSSTMVPGIGMSWLETLYIPLYLLLIIAFYKYFSFVLDKRPLLPMNKEKFLRNLVITFVGVFLFELLVGAMVDNVGFPSWSYMWHDITILLTGGWVLVIWISTWLVDKYYIDKSLTERFILSLAYATVIVAPIETWLIHSGHRVYLSSTVGNFSGVMVPILNIPVEVIFAIPFYLALAVAFSRYWAIMFDNRL
jgi:hypothetical protein